MFMFENCDVAAAAAACEECRFVMELERLTVELGRGIAERFWLAGPRVLKRVKNRLASFKATQLLCAEYYLREDFATPSSSSNCI